MGRYGNSIDFSLASFKNTNSFMRSMEKEAVEKKVVYSETIAGQDIDAEHKALLESMERLEEENRIIGSTLNRVEEETAMLRELFNNANKFYCYVSQNVQDVRAGDNVLVDQKTLNVVEKVHSTSNNDVEKFVIMDKPKENWKSIGGLKNEIEEVKEVIELPLKNPKLFEKVGIQPPKGILLYGPPGTGKTLLAKAVANSTDATFIEVVGSELVQKFIGEGAKLVKDIFTLARSKAPSIIFIDEIDALASTRMDTGTSGEREVNRTFMQLLAEIDGFDHLDNVKIIGATNRADILDTAIIRPGRLDRLIEVGLPDEEGRLDIIKVHTQKMNLQKVMLKKVSAKMQDFSGAEIRAVCTEAGYFAIRENREYVTQRDFEQAIEKVRLQDEDEEDGKFFG